MNRYKTAEVAAAVGIHPNTVRLYEKLQLIPKPQRLPNGYRVFTDQHIAQCKLVRLAFQIEILQNGLRNKIVQMVKISAAGDFDQALVLTQEYLMQIRRERANAQEAINIVTQIRSGEAKEPVHFYKRKELSELLNISMDTLRNWEMNGLLTVKRKQNGYRVYTDPDIDRLKMIRSLRCANYSLQSILRMLQQLSQNPSADIEEALNTPQEDLVAANDKLITSLSAAEENAGRIICMLQSMKARFKTNHEDF